MPRKAPALTDAMVRNAKSPKDGAGWREISDGGCAGLKLRISPRGERVWALRAQVAGKRLRCGIGSYPTVGLKEARRRAEEYKSAAEEGITPEALDRQRNAAAMTLADAHAAYLEAMQGRLSERYMGLKRRMFEKHVHKKLGAKPLRQIARADLIELSHDVTRRGYPTQANRVMNEVMACLRWCAEHEYIESVPTLGKHARRKEEPRDRTLTDTELRELWDGAGRLYPLPRDFIRLLVLTGQRRDEVRLIHASEIDTAERVWVIPSTRYKTGINHVVPLSAPAWEIVQRLMAWSPGGYLLPSRDGPHKPYSGQRSGMEQLRREVPSAKTYTLHDIRRTVRTGLRRIGVADDVAEAVIGHMPSGIKGVYDRYDRLEEKRDALERWAQVVFTSGATRNPNVVPFAASASAQ